MVNSAGMSSSSTTTFTPRSDTSGIMQSRGHHRFKHPNSWRCADAKSFAWAESSLFAARSAGISAEGRSTAALRHLHGIVDLSAIVPHSGNLFGHPTRELKPIVTEKKGRPHTHRAKAISWPRAPTFSGPNRLCFLLLLRLSARFWQVCQSPALS
jgi:hypothetical protein